MRTFRTHGFQALAVLLLCGQAMGQGYTIQVLPPLPGHADSFACGIGESGVVVGMSRTGNSGNAVRWDNGVPTSLGTLPGWARAVALDVSNDGTIIVGEAHVSGGSVVPFVWESGIGIIAVPGPSVGVAGCWAINDGHVIVGRAFDPNSKTPEGSVACRWRKDAFGAWQFEPLPLPAGTIAANAYGINNAGEITGFAGNTSWTDIRAVRWTASGPVILTNLPGLGTSVAGINMAGQCVGEFEVTAGGAWRAFYHDGTTSTDLGTMTYPNSYAHRINNAGTIIGQSYANGASSTGFPNDNKRAIIWTVGGTMTAANDLIPAGSGWDVKQLWDLTESGRIVGLGRFNGLWRGCLLTPICYANCDASTTAPVLNVNDFVCFQQRFAAADPYANCDNSTTIPILNVNDFVCFQQQFAAGCPQ